MKGYVYVGLEGTKTDKMVARWVERGLKFVAGVEKVAKGKKKAKDVLVSNERRSEKGVSLKKVKAGLVASGKLRA